jgi:hypothetical protein
MAAQRSMPAVTLRARAWEAELVVAARPELPREVAVGVGRCILLDRGGAVGRFHRVFGIDLVTAGRAGRLPSRGVKRARKHERERGGQAEPRLPPREA